MFNRRGLRVRGIDILADVVNTINGDQNINFELGLQVAHRKIRQVHNPYANGTAAQQTAEIVSQFR